jgi:hypothetical protein
MPDNRARYGNVIVEVLEVINCSAQQAGDREWEWAEKFGYKKGSHYVNNGAGKLTSIERALNMKRNAMNGITGFQNYTQEQRTLYSSVGGKQTAFLKKGAYFQQIQCPFCYKEGQEAAMKRWHFDNCKDKYHSYV